MGACGNTRSMGRRNVSSAQATRVPSINNYVSLVRTQWGVHHGCNSCCDLQWHPHIQQLGARAGGVHTLSSRGQLQGPVLGREPVADIRIQGRQQEPGTTTGSLAATEALAVNMIFCCTVSYCMCVLQGRRVTGSGRGMQIHRWRG